MIIDEWNECYEGRWGDWIVPEAFSHPAKFSRALIERIYDHAIKEGWVKTGDTILDPFAGVALGGLNAMSCGLNWVGVELEEKFIKLVEQNIDLWKRQLSGWPNLGSARIVQGDSRRLKEVIQAVWCNKMHGFSSTLSMADDLDPIREAAMPRPEIEKADIVISSPPFRQTEGGERGIIDTGYGDGSDKVGDRCYAKHKKAFTPGNLANFKEGKFEMVVGSPPFVNCDNIAKKGNMTEGKPEWAGGRDSAKRAKGDYFNGQSPGQLGAMKEGSFDLYVSRKEKGQCQQETDNLECLILTVTDHLIPTGTVDKQDGEDLDGTCEEGKLKRGININVNTVEQRNRSKSIILTTKKSLVENGITPSQISSHCVDLVTPKRKGKGLPSSKLVLSVPESSIQETPIKKFAHPSVSMNPKRGHGQDKIIKEVLNEDKSTFWEASREIVQQCFDLLKDGGHAIWVTKDYVKAKQRVPFTERWLALCESVGFRLVCRHHAMLTITKTTKNVTKIVERKSFFRRLAEIKIRAQNYWVTLPRVFQANYLHEAKKSAWQYYYKLLADDDPDHPAIFPTKSKVTSNAQIRALSDYSGDVRDWDDERIIYWEDVICLIK